MILFQTSSQATALLISLQSVIRFSMQFCVCVYVSNKKFGIQYCNKFKNWPPENELLAIFLTVHE